MTAKGDEAFISQQQSQDPALADLQTIYYGRATAKPVAANKSQLIEDDFTDYKVSVITPCMA